MGTGITFNGKGFHSEPVQEVNYKVETFNGHWWSEGIVFGTREEAEASMSAPSHDVRRIVETDDPANYRIENGKLTPGKRRFDPATCTWEDYMKGLV